MTPGPEGVYRLGDHAPTIGAGCWIAPGARIIGRVRIGADCSIWFGAVLRGDIDPITIGEGTNIQDNCVLHTDTGFPMTIGRNVTIGHTAILHGCIIADHALVGMGATVLNGARIGADALLGANALLPEGKEVPPGMLAVGAPARVLRARTEREIARSRAVAQGYRERTAHYRATLRPCVQQP